jgi:hypothetical protein
MDESIFINHIHSHINELADADAIVHLSFQNLLYASLVALEAVVEDGEDAGPIFVMDEEILSNEYGFTLNESVPIYNSSEYLDVFRTYMKKATERKSIDEIDRLEEAVSKMMDSLPEGIRFFTIAANNNGQLDDSYVEDALKRTVPEIPKSPDVAAEPEIPKSPAMGAEPEIPKSPVESTVPEIPKSPVESTVPEIPKSPAESTVPSQSPSPHSILKKSRNVTRRVRKRRSITPIKKTHTRRVRWADDTHKIE